MTTAQSLRLNLPSGWNDPSSLAHLCAMRRHAHRHPEAGWCEFRTAAHWASFFESIGFKIKAGREVLLPEYVRGRDAAAARAALEEARNSGVDKVMLERLDGYPAFTAEWDTGMPGKTVAIRVELDALAIDEPTDPEHIPAREGFLSEHHGFMHACGHDGHQAVAAELARFIVENQNHLSGRVRFVFQPAEEGSRGAFPMVQAGVFDDVDVILCAHLGTDLEAGTVVAAPEKFLSTTKIDFEFRGRPSHAGMQPQLGRNALLAAANAAINMMALPRHGEGMTRVNVGSLHAGEGRNVVPSHASMEVEVRGENGTINRALVEEAILRAQGAAMSFGVECRHAIVGEATDFKPDDAIAQLITVCAHRARRILHGRRGVSVGAAACGDRLRRTVSAHALRHVRAAARCADRELALMVGYPQQRKPQGIMMKKFRKAAAAALALSFALSAGSAFAEFKDFTVNGEPVTRVEQEKLAAEALAVSGNPHQEMTAEFESQVREMVVRAKVLSAWAKKEGLEKTDEVKAELARAEELVLMEAAVKAYLKAHPVDEKALRAAYDEELARWGKEEVRVRHLMVADEEEAKKLLADIQKGASLAKLAAEKSIDLQSKPAGGILEWTSPSVFSEALSEAVKSLKKGEIAKKPIHSPGGWHIVKLEDVRPAELYPSFEVRRDDLERMLVDKKVQAFIDEQVKATVIK